MADSTRFNTLEDAYRVIVTRSKQNLLTGCMEWTGTKCNKGYGSIRRDRVMQKTHRIAWEYFNGPIPDGMHVLHACDNPSCVEVVHLFLGTNGENIADKCAKDRSGKKLCIEEVAKIKEMLSSGMSNKAIAKIYGVNQCSISRIKLGQRWTHV